MVKLIVGFIAGLFVSLGALPSAQEIVDKWVRRASQATSDYKTGIARVTTAPGELAAAKVDKYIAGIQESVDKWARRVAGVSLAEWKRLATDKGGERYAGGVNAAKAKALGFWNEFRPVLEAVQSEANAMPDLSFEDRLNKAMFVMRKLHEFNRS